MAATSIFNASRILGVASVGSKARPAFFSRDHCSLSPFRDDTEGLYRTVDSPASEISGEDRIGSALGTSIRFCPMAWDTRTMDKGAARALSLRELKPQKLQSFIFLTICIFAAIIAAELTAPREHGNRILVIWRLKRHNGEPTISVINFEHDARQSAAQRKNPGFNRQQYRAQGNQVLSSRITLAAVASGRAEASRAVVRAESMPVTGTQGSFMRKLGVR